MQKHPKSAMTEEALTNIIRERARREVMTITEDWVRVRYQETDGARRMDFLADEDGNAAVRITRNPDNTVDVLINGTAVNQPLDRTSGEYDELGQQALRAMIARKTLESIGDEFPTAEILTGERVARELQSSAALVWLGLKDKVDTPSWLANGSTTQPKHITDHIVRNLLTSEDARDVIRACGQHDRRPDNNDYNSAVLNLDLYKRMLDQDPDIIRWYWKLVHPKQPVRRRLEGPGEMTHLLREEMGLGKAAWKTFLLIGINHWMSEERSATRIKSRESATCWPRPTGKEYRNSTPQTWGAQSQGAEDDGKNPGKRQGKRPRG